MNKRTPSSPTHPVPAFERAASVWLLVMMLKKVREELVRILHKRKKKLDSDLKSFTFSKAHSG